MKIWTITLLVLEISLVTLAKDTLRVGRCPPRRSSWGSEFVNYIYAENHVFRILLLFSGLSIFSIIVHQIFYQIFKFCFRPQNNYLSDVSRHKYLYPTTIQMDDVPSTISGSRQFSWHGTESVISNSKARRHFSEIDSTNSWETSYKLLKLKLEDAESQIAVFKHKIEEMKTASEEVESVKRERSLFKRKLETAHREKKDLQKQMSSIQQDMKKLQKQMEIAKENQKLTVQNLENSQKTSRILLRDKKILLKQLEELKRDRQEAKHLIGKLQTEKKLLQKKSVSAERDLEKLRKKTQPAVADVSCSSISSGHLDQVEKKSLQLLERKTNYTRFVRSASQSDMDYTKDHGSLKQSGDKITPEDLPELHYIPLDVSKVKQALQKVEKNVQRNMMRRVLRELRNSEDGYSAEGGTPTIKSLMSQNKSSTSVRSGILLPKTFDSLGQVESLSLTNLFTPEDTSRSRFFGFLNEARENYISDSSVAPCLDLRGLQASGKKDCKHITLKTSSSDSDTTDFKNCIEFLDNQSEIKHMAISSHSHRNITEQDKGDGNEFNTQKSRIPINASPYRSFCNFIAATVSNAVSTFKSKSTEKFELVQKGSQLTKQQSLHAAEKKQSDKKFIEKEKSTQKLSESQLAKQIWSDNEDSNDELYDAREYISETFHGDHPRTQEKKPIITNEITNFTKAHPAELADNNKTASEHALSSDVIEDLNIVEGKVVRILRTRDSSPLWRADEIDPAERKAGDPKTFDYLLIGNRRMKIPKSPSYSPSLQWSASFTTLGGTSSDVLSGADDIIFSETSIHKQSTTSHMGNLMPSETTTSGCSSCTNVSGETRLVTNSSAFQRFMEAVITSNLHEQACTSEA